MTISGQRGINILRLEKSNGSGLKKENVNVSLLNFSQFCWVTANFQIFEKCIPIPSYALLITALQHPYFIDVIIDVKGMTRIY